MKVTCQSQGEVVVACSQKGEAYEWDREDVLDSNSALQERNVGTLPSFSLQNIILMEPQGLDHTEGRGPSYMLALIPESTNPLQSIRLIFLYQSSFIFLVSFLFLSQSCELFPFC